MGLKLFTIYQRQGLEQGHLPKRSQLLPAHEFSQVCGQLWMVEGYMEFGENPRVNRAVRDLTLAPFLELKSLKRKFLC